jgi:hypothetical protein
MKQVMIFKIGSLKNVIYTFFMACLLLLSSCTRVVYSHEDYMNAIRTKNDAVSTFGSPTSKNKEGNLEVWTYILGSGTLGTGLVNGYGSYGNNSVNASILGSSNYTNYTRQVTIIFEGENAKSWNSRGVDFKKEETDTNKSIWATFGWLGGTTLLIIILSAAIG